MTLEWRRRLWDKWLVQCRYRYAAPMRAVGVSQKVRRKADICSIPNRFHPSIAYLRALLAVPGPSSRSRPRSMTRFPPYRPFTIASLSPLSPLIRSRSQACSASSPPPPSPSPSPDPSPSSTLCETSSSSGSECNGRAGRLRWKRWPTSVSDCRTSIMCLRNRISWWRLQRMHRLAYSVARAAMRLSISLSLLRSSSSGCVTSSSWPTTP